MRPGNGSPVALIAFELAGRACGLPVEQVVEVLRVATLTPVLDAAHWLAGMLDLRGAMVPVIHTRQRSSQPALEPGLDTPIIIAELDGFRAGLIADELIGRLELPGAAVRIPPAWVGAGYPVQAVGRAGEQVVLILDLASLTMGAHESLQFAPVLANGARDLEARQA